MLLSSLESEIYAETNILNFFKNSLYLITKDYDCLPDLWGTW